MDGRDFLRVAHELATGPTEAHWRAAVGRAYYALMLEGRDALRRWGRIPPPRQNVHAFVRIRFVFAGNQDLKDVGDTLDRLSQGRNHADYDVASVGPYGNNARAVQAVTFAGNAISLLDQIDNNPVRRAAAIASLPP